MPRNCVGVYGNIRLVKGYCQECRGFAFVIGGKIQCCDLPYRAEPNREKRESIAEYRRLVPGRKTQKLILAQQDYCCFYCFKRFGSVVYVGYPKKPVHLRRHWDHMVPFAYSQNNSTENFVAACHLCNMWKSSLMFQTVDEARVHLAIEWENHQWSSDE